MGKPNHMTTKARIAAYGSAGALLVAGIVCEAAVNGGAGQIVGFTLIGLGGITLISLVFLEIGLSEDRERAAEEHPPTPSPRPQPKPAPKLDRSRGRRRRLG
jgi:hypothetical protein